MFFAADFLKISNSVKGFSIGLKNFWDRRMWEIICNIIVVINDMHRVYFNASFFLFLVPGGSKIVREGSGKWLYSPRLSEVVFGAWKFISLLFWNFFVCEAFVSYSNKMKKFIYTCREGTVYCLEAALLGCASSPELWVPASVCKVM